MLEPHFIQIVLMFAGVVACALACWVLAETFSACLPHREAERVPGERPAVDVLIPAHNEERVLSATLSSLKGQLTERDRLWVIADNCADNTADIARSCGARVIHRRDARNRGKGYALDFALSSIEVDDRRVFLIVDADCQVQDGSVDRLTRLAAGTGRPVQASYEILPSPHGGSRDALRHFAVLLKNHIRPRGLHRMGGPCLLTGSGMAFPATLLRDMNLANDNTADDMQLTCDIVLSGAGPVFCQEAVVRSRFPSGGREARLQRKRWVHGHIFCLLRYVPRLLACSLVQRRWDVLPVALEISVPPLTLFALALVLLAGLSLGAGLAGWGWASLMVSTAAFLALAATVSLAWSVFARRRVSWRAVLALPGHGLGILPIGFGYWLRRQKWAPTARDVTCGTTGVDVPSASLRMPETGLHSAPTSLGSEPCEALQATRGAGEGCS